MSSGQHPWIEAAETFGAPRPVPTGAKFELVSVGQADARVDMVMMMVVTPVGCTSVFLDVDMFKNLIGSGRDILDNLREKSMDNHPTSIQPASQTDLRNAVRGLTLLHNHKDQ